MSKDRHDGKTTGNGLFRVVADLVSETPKDVLKSSGPGLLRQGNFATDEEFTTIDDKLGLP